MPSRTMPSDCFCCARGARPGNPGTARSRTIYAEQCSYAYVYAIALQLPGKGEALRVLRFDHRLHPPDIVLEAPLGRTSPAARSVSSRQRRGFRCLTAPGKRCIARAPLDCRAHAAGAARHARRGQVPGIARDRHEGDQEHRLSGGCIWWSNRRTRRPRALPGSMQPMAYT